MDAARAAQLEAEHRNARRRAQRVVQLVPRRFRLAPRGPLQRLEQQFQRFFHAVHAFLKVHVRPEERNSQEKSVLKVFA
jgi:hypothetical protein